MILIKAIQHLDEGILCGAQAVDAVTLGARGALYNTSDVQVKNITVLFNARY